MSAEQAFTAVTGLVYPFGVLAVMAALAAWLSRFPAYRQFLRQGAGERWLWCGLVGGLLLCLYSACNFRPAVQAAAVVGFFGGALAGGVATLLLALLTVATGWSPLVALALLLTGPAGALMRRAGRWGPALVVLSGALWFPLAWHMDWIPAGARAHLATFSPAQLQWMMVGTTLVNAATTALLLWMLEYLARREERRSAEVLLRMLGLFDRILHGLRQPFPNEELCRAVGAAVEAECLAVGRHGEVAASRPGLPLPPFEPPEEPEVRGGLVLLPLRDTGALVLPVPPGHPLAAADPALLRAMAALLDSELVRQRSLRQQAALEETRYRMLSAQIQPHFLFNALTTVAALVLSRPAEAHDVIVDLAHYLRGAFARQGDWIPLSEELESVKAYLAVEKARFRDRLTVDLRVDPAVREASVPSMLLQPLVENAVRHGRGGRVTVRVGDEGDHLLLAVGDDGVGFPQDQPPTGHGVGLSNVRQRLHALFGEGSRFTVDSAPGRGTTISFRVPRTRAAGTDQGLVAAVPARDDPSGGLTP